MTQWGTLSPGTAILCEDTGEPVVTKILLVSGDILSLVTDKMFPPSDIRFLDASIESQNQCVERIRQERSKEGS
jgi:hypothetical protein